MGLKLFVKADKFFTMLKLPERIKTSS